MQLIFSLRKTEIEEDEGGGGGERSKEERIKRM